MRRKLTLMVSMAILSLLAITSPAFAQYPPETTTSQVTATTTEAPAVDAGNAAPADGSLARTGSDTAKFVLVGGVLVLVGAFVLVSRRRSHAIV